MGNFEHTTTTEPTDRARICAEIERLQAHGERPSCPVFSAALTSLINAHTEAFETPDDDGDRFYHQPDPLLVRQALRTISFLIGFREFEPIVQRLTTAQADQHSQRHTEESYAG